MSSIVFSPPSFLSSDITPSFPTTPRDGASGIDFLQISPFVFMFLPFSSRFKCDLRYLVSKSNFAALIQYLIIFNHGKIRERMIDSIMNQ